MPSDVQRDVVVVNNNCTDGTDTVIEEFRTRLPLQRLFEGRAGVSSSRNAALARATADYLAFIDDDALADDSWLVELTAAARAYPDAAAIGGVIEMIEKFAEYRNMFTARRFGLASDRAQHGMQRVHYSRPPR